MAEQTALTSRNNAAAALAEELRQLKKYKAQPNPKKRLLEQKLKRVEEAKEELMARHYYYGEKSGNLPESDDMTNWFNPKMDDAVETMDEVYVMIEDIDDAIEKTEATSKKATERIEKEEKRVTQLKVAELQMKNDEEVINDRIEKLKTLVEDVEKNTKEDSDLAEVLLAEVELALGDQIKSWNQVKEMTNSDEDRNKVFQKETEIKGKIAESRSQAQAFINKLNPRPTVITSSERSSKEDSSDKSMMKVERMRLPTFNGDCRSYARFKKDFKDIVEPAYPNETQKLFTLKDSCLKGDPKKLVANITSIKEIWERLDLKYGDSIDIVDMVIDDIQKFQIPKQDVEVGFINLVDTVERGLLDLSYIDATADIANAYTVNLLVKKLPKRIQTRWFEKDVGEEVDEGSVDEASSITSTSSKRGGKERFEELLAFLKKVRHETQSCVKLREKKGDEESSKRDGKPRFSNGANGQQKPTKHNNKCLIHPDAQTPHLTRVCKVFLKKNCRERGEIVRDTEGCKFCLSLSHPGVPCPFEGKWGPCNINGCTEYHSRLVHGCGIVGISMYTFTYKSISHTLLLIQDVRTSINTIKVFWDNGSSLALVSRRYVRRSRLVGIPVTYELITVGNKVTLHHTKIYEISLIDRNGDTHKITAYEIEEICGKIGQIKIGHLVHSFPSLKEADVKRHGGEIELLIGMEHAALHPVRTAVHEGLCLYDSEFGTGKILGGTHQLIEGESPEFSAAVSCHTQARVGRVYVAHKCTSPDCGVDFFSAEDFGVAVPPRCPKCRACKDCSFETQQLSRIQQTQLAVIRNNLKLDPVKKRWETKYPYAASPETLENNYQQAVAFLERTENRLRRTGVTATKNYCEQIKDFIRRGVIRKITEKEQRDYKGPIFYLTHHEVMKEDSASTPCRLVVNSSLKYKGVSLNDILMKGPNSLSDLYGIQLKFRTHTYALVCDIKKMYHSIFTTELEKNIRRILWRDMDSSKKPEVYGFERLTFGDKPAGCIAAVAVKETAKIFKHVDPIAAQKIEDDIYVDDMATGAETKGEIESLKTSVKKIFSNVGMDIKGFVASGDTAADALALLGSGEVSRVLGMNWDPPTDDLTITIHINVSKKKKGVKTEPDLKYEEIPRILEIRMTKRLILRLVYSCYDPLGLVCVITVQLKIELRKLYGKDQKFGWDDALPREVVERWVELLQLLKKVEDIRFKRCIKPSGAVGDPHLVLFNDGSSEAMCVLAYLRWKMKEGKPKCVLWTGKTRVAPLRKTTIPRLEMQSAVMSARLRKSIQKHTEMKFERVIHIVDSTCTLALLNNETSPLGEFMGNRVTEVVESCKPEEFYHVPSKDNIADLGTRCDATIEDIVPSSPYQCAPAWLSLEPEEWPVTQDYTGTKIPEEEIVKVSANVVATVNTPVINIEDFREDSYDFLMSVVARLLKIFKTKTLEIDALTADDILAAEAYCLKLSMKYTLEDLNAGKLTSLRPIVDENGIVILNSRANKGMKLHYNKEKFPILTYRDPLSYLWIKHIHEEDHSGITRTVAKSRRQFWIVKSRKIADKVRTSCYRCRLLDKVLAMQLMAPLPVDRLAMAPVFFITSMDLVGPMTIKDTVKQRTHKKVWGVVFNCVATRALHIDLTEDYGTDSILQTIRRFTDVRGCPSEFRSDQGSQLTSAAKDVTELISDWKWEEVSSWCAEKRIKWTVVPAEGQHQNGLSESLIRSTKRTIMHKIGNSTLTFAELQTALFDIANIINSRPIGVVTGSDPDQPRAITPNDLILGRSAGEVPQGPFDNRRSVNKRFRFVQDLVTEWWESWYAVVLPSLVPSYKWQQRHRNVREGDVCLIKYNKIKRATYRLGRVIEVEKGEDGLVRKVVLKYKLSGEKNFRTVSRPIHGIAVIVPVEEQKDEVTDNEDTEDQNKDKSNTNDNKCNVAASVCNCSAITDKSTLNPHAEAFQSNLSNSL